MLSPDSFPSKHLLTNDATWARKNYLSQQAFVHWIVFCVVTQNYQFREVKRPPFFIPIENFYRTVIVCD